MQLLVSDEKSVVEEGCARLHVGTNYTFLSACEMEEKLQMPVALATPILLRYSNYCVRPIPFSMLNSC